MYIGQLYVIILFIYGSNGVDEKPRLSAALLATKNETPRVPSAPLVIGPHPEPTSTKVAPTSTPENITTADPHKTSSVTPTKTPPTSSTSPSTTTTSTTPSTPMTTNATTPSPTTPANTTTESPSTIVPTTPASTHSPTTSTISPPTTPTPKHDRSFDAPSFIGGFILSLALVAIIFVSYKFYKSRTGANNYHTL